MTKNQLKTTKVKAHS